MTCRVVYQRSTHNVLFASGQEKGMGEEAEAALDKEEWRDTIELVHVTRCDAQNLY